MIKIHLPYLSCTIEFPRKRYDDNISLGRLRNNKFPIVIYRQFNSPYKTAKELKKLFPSLRLICTSYGFYLDKQEVLDILQGQLKILKLV